MVFLIDVIKIIFYRHTILMQWVRHFRFAVY